MRYKPPVRFRQLVDAPQKAIYEQPQNCFSTAGQSYCEATRQSTPQQVAPIGTERHHVSMQQIHGVRGGTATASIEWSRHQRRPITSLTEHGGLRGAAPVPEAQPLPFRRTIRRHELRQIIPLAETTIYGMEQRGEFPRRFRLTARCVVWDLEEIEAWIEERKQASHSAKPAALSGPDVRLRRYRPVR
jgi:prophage regulatory protein